MTTFYLDYVNGNDANDGSSWALAWKTVTSGATAARIAPGDIIRIAKSPDPTSLGQTALWTDLSRAVVLQTGALTANIDLCEIAWTASASVTATASTTRKEGTYSCSLAIAAAFTTGLVAFRLIDVAGIDFSAYQQVSFWIRSSVAIAAGVLTLDLCSDVAGAVSVNSIAIPAVPGINKWQVVTVDTAGALGNAIKSISVNAISDPGTPTILIDNILACKASGSADSLTLSSLISKNSAAQGGTEGWFGIKSINITAIQLDNDTDSSSGAGRGYSGVTETVTTYKRETIKTTVASVAGTLVQSVQDSGTFGNDIKFQGGWDTATTIQDGETYFDGQNGFGYGLYLISKSYTTLNYLNFCRYYYGIYYYTACQNNTITTLSNSNNNSVGVFYDFVCANNTINTLYNINNNITGVYYYNRCNNNRINILSNANNNDNIGILYYNTCYFNKIIMDSSVKNNGWYGIQLRDSSEEYIYSSSISGNGTAGVYIDFGLLYLFNTVITEAIEVTGLGEFANVRVFSNKHDNTTNNHWIFTDNGTINSQTAVRHTASGIAWKLSPTSTNRSSNYPLDLSITKIAVNSNTLVTVKAWFRRTNTGISGQLICKGKQISGVDNDVTTSMTVAADIWEQLSISMTPTENGVIEISVQAFGGTTYSVYVDDMEITQT